MKKLFIVFTVSALVFCGCIDNTKNDDRKLEGTTTTISECENYNTEGLEEIKGEIVDINENSITVAPIDEGYYLGGNNRINFYYDDVSEFSLWDIVEIYYNGNIQETFPAQADAEYICMSEKYEGEKRENGDIISAYEAFIDDIYNEDVALNDSITEIALNINDGGIITDDEKDILISRISRKYGLTVFEGNYDSLFKSGKITENRYNNGIIITIENVEKTNDGYSYSIDKYRSGLGAVGYNAKAFFEFTLWNISQGDMYMS